MKSDRFSWVGRGVGVITRHGSATLAVIGVVTVLSVWIASDRFRMNSDLGALIHQEADWRDDFERFEAAFPMLIDTAFVVVSGVSFRDLEDTTRRIERALVARSETFSDVYAPAADPFFRDHALLYLDTDDLEAMVDRLARAQPVLTAVAEDPSLRGVLEVIQDGVENEPASGFDRILDLVIPSADAVLRGEPGAVRWTDEFFENEATLYRIIFVKGRADYGQPLPNARVMAELREVIAKTAIEPGVEVRLTGEVALAHEEIGAAQAGVALAGSISVVLLAGILILGIRSARIIGAIFALLTIGVFWTTAWALIAVGEFNTLSLVFLAMFFGIGGDFAIHYCLCYEQALAQGDSNVVALRRAADDVGGATLLCALTTMVGFLGFVPTDYAGLADLGVISAGGIFIAALLTFTLVPALFAVFGAPRRVRRVDVPAAEGWAQALIHRRRFLLPALALLTMVSVGLTTQQYFDFSVLALRNPEAESMRTLRVLEQEGIVTDYSLSVLGSSPQGDATLREVAALPLVAEARNPDDYVPADQEEKVALLADLSILLESALAPARREDAPSDRDRAAAVRRLISSIEAYTGSEPARSARLRQFSERLDGLLALGPGALKSFELALVSELATELDWLRRAVNVVPVGFEDLPDALRARLESADGSYLSQVLPRDDLTSVANLAAFVEGVRAVAPHATGRPVIEWGVGNIVVRAFIEALAFAIIAITIILVIAMRSARDALMVLLPLSLAATFTVAALVLLDIPFNMANVLVLPLIFGMGVDNGIHVVDRFRREVDIGRFMHSSTPRAVVLSTLTNVAAFAALMVSPHRGTASIGTLLTLAMGFLLVFTVLVLPVVLTLFSPSEGAAEQAGGEEAAAE